MRFKTLGTPRDSLFGFADEWASVSATVRFTFEGFGCFRVRAEEARARVVGPELSVREAINSRRAQERRTDSRLTAVDRETSEGQRNAAHLDFRVRQR